MDKEKTLKKLRFDPLAVNLILNAPDFYRNSVAPDQFDSQVGKNRIGKYDFIQVFAIEQQKPEALVQLAKPAGKHDAIFWACYPNCPFERILSTGTTEIIIHLGSHSRVFRENDT